MTEHVARVLPDDPRVAVHWCTYRGDARAVLDAGHNPLQVFSHATDTPLGPWPIPNVMAGLLGTGRGARYTPNNRVGQDEFLWPIEARWDDETDTTRVGWTFTQPPRQP